jgi:hypothetical protein
MARMMEKAGARNHNQDKQNAEKTIENALEVKLHPTRSTSADIETEKPHKFKFLSLKDLLRRILSWREKKPSAGIPF